MTNDQTSTSTAAPPQRLTLQDALLYAAGFVVLTALARFMIARADGMVPDDTYIFFRYARNLVDGHGWTFNLGQETANGATSPLWVVVLAAAYALHGDMAANAWWLYAVTLGGAGTVMFASTRRLGLPAAGAIAGTLVVLDPVLMWVIGMESGLFLLLTVGFVHLLLLRRNDLAGGICGGLLVLARPEGVLLVLIVVALRLWDERRVPWKVALGGLIAVTPWIVYSLIEFGTPVAGTLAGKTAQGESGFFGPDFVFLRYGRTMAARPWSLLLMVGGALGALAAWRSTALRRPMGVLVVYVGAHLALYGLVIKPPAYIWYYAPEYLVLTLLTGVAIATAARFVAARLPEGTARIAVAAGIATVLAAIPAVLSVRDQHRGDDHADYRAAARWLQANSADDATVAAAEIGVVSWNADRPIVDFLGLLSSTSADEVGRGDLSTWIGREEPDYYIQHIPVWEMEEPASALPWFGRAYQPVFQTDLTPKRRVRVYKKVASQAVAEASGPSVLVTDDLVDRLEDAGATIGADERVVLGAALEIYLGSRDLQQEFEVLEGEQRGTAITRLLDEIIETNRTNESDDPVLEDLRSSLPDDLVVPLAPTR